MKNKIAANVSFYKKNVTYKHALDLAFQEICFAYFFSCDIKYNSIIWSENTVWHLILIQGLYCCVLILNSVVYLLIR